MNNDRSVLKHGQAYPLGDPLTLAEQEKCGVKGEHPQRQAGIMAVWTGEKRPPKKGERYLSGAIVVAYLAPNDLTQPFQIARLVKVETETRQIIIEVGERRPS